METLLDLIARSNSSSCLLTVMTLVEMRGCNPAHTLSTESRTSDDSGHSMGKLSDELSLVVGKDLEGSLDRDGNPLLLDLSGTASFPLFVTW